MGQERPAHLVPPGACSARDFFRHVGATVRAGFAGNGFTSLGRVLARSAGFFFMGGK